MKFQHRTKSQGAEPAKDGSTSTSLSDVQSPQEVRVLLPVGRGEIPISQLGLASHFIGNSSNLMRQIRCLIDIDPHTTMQNQITCTSSDETLTFFRRQRGCHIIWALPLADKPRLAKMMGWVERVELGQLQDNEIALSGRGLSPYFIGDADEFRRQLQGLLRAVPDEVALRQMECTVSGETFTFLKRQMGKHLVWTIPLSDKSRLAKAMGWAEKIRLDQLQDNEIAISRKGLSAHFIGDASNLGKKLQGLLIADPQRTALRQIECTISEETFTFLRRQSGKHLVWALPLADKPRLAKAMGWSEKIEVGSIQENEMGISQSCLALHFHGRTTNLRKRLQELLITDPEKTTLHQVECTIDGETFTFFRRQAGKGNVVWALPLADKSRLGRAMRWAEKIGLDQLQENEIAVSGSGLLPYFIGDPNEFRKQLQGLLNADPERTTFRQVECTVGRELFTFYRRQNGPRVIWALPLADKSRLAKAMNWSERIGLRQLQENEIGISQSGLSLHFIGRPYKLTKQLRELLGTDPQRTALHQIECAIGEESFTLEKRQTGSSIVWAVPLSARLRLAKAMNWEIKEEKEPSTGVAALATFLSAVETHNAASSKQPGSSTQG